MIFWTTVLTFIIGMMLAMLFPRNDRESIEELPVSEAYVASFVAQHQFARDYADQISFTLPYINTIIGSDEPIGDAAHIHIFKDEFDDIETGYMPEIMPDEVSRKTFPTDGSYASGIICLDELDKRGTIANDDSATPTLGLINTGKITSCKTNKQTFKYVLTYGALFPETPVNHNLYRQRLDITAEDNNIARNRIMWEKALKKRTKGDPDCGFIGLENSIPYIYGVDGQKRRIPKAIYDVFSTYLDEASELQPIFCITPVNTPYVMEGLIYHFDATMNGSTTTGAPLHVDKKTNGWVNIVSQSAVSFTGTALTDSWHPDDQLPAAFMGDTYLNVDISNATTKIQSEFTISFVINLNTHIASDSIQGETALFSTNQGGYPYVIATHKNDQLTVTVHKDDSTILGQISATVPSARRIVSVSYVAGPRFHHLYVNGSLAKTETFANGDFLTPIDSTTLQLGASTRDAKSNLNADVYNIKIYNRSLNKDEINHNLKTDRKRYKF